MSKFDVFSGPLPEAFPEGLGSQKLIPKPSKIGRKPERTEANPATRKSNNFEKENTWKTILESEFLQEGAKKPNRANVDFLLLFPILEKPIKSLENQ